MTGELINRALSLCKNGQLAEAEQVLRQVIAAGANDFQVQYLYAGVLYEQQKVPEALTAVEAALKQSPDAGEAMMLHGLLLHAANRPLEALNGLSKVVALTPTMPMPGTITASCCPSWIARRRPSLRSTGPWRSIPHHWPGITAAHRCGSLVT